MGVASLVLGIISVIVGFIPLCGTWAIIPAIVGIILGCVDISKKKKEGLPKGKAIAGVICSAIAVAIIFFYGFVVINTTKKAINDTDWKSVGESIANEIENAELNYDE